MISKRWLIHLLSLFAYVWSATCLGESLLVHQFTAHDSRTQMIYDATDNGALIFHHPGHADSHEPQAAPTPSAEIHADHIVKLSCDDDRSVFSAKTQTPEPAFFVLPLLLQNVVDTEARVSPLNTQPLHCRNLPIALVQITKLRI